MVETRQREAVLFWRSILQSFRAVLGLPSQRTPSPMDCHHEWVVYATARAPPCLELECSRCGVLGNVFDPSSEEWNRAFHAPSKPYKWREPGRVTWTRQ